MGGWDGIPADWVDFAFLAVIITIIAGVLVGACIQSPNPNPAPSHTRTADTTTCHPPTCYPDPIPRAP